MPKRLTEIIQEVVQISCLAGVIFFLLSACAAAQENKSSWPKYLENTLGMKFVLIPKGGFTMGSAQTPGQFKQQFPGYEMRRYEELYDEVPVHPVHITKDFYLGQHELTVGQFKLFLKESGYVPESIRDGTGGYGFRADYDPKLTGRGDNFEGRDLRYSWNNPGFPQDDDHPVVNVTYDDAMEIAAWLTKKEGVRYRLPTEAEWEYACRAGATTQFSSGNDQQSLVNHANVFDLDAARYWPQWKELALQEQDAFSFTSPVGAFKPNNFDLYDMHGNVWEWVSDWHADDYYQYSPIDDPTGPVQGEVKVRRGGSWHTWPLYVRCSYRNWNATTTRYTLLGVRLLRETP